MRCVNTNMWWTVRLLVEYASTSILPAYYQHTTSILPAYYQPTTSILPAYYQPTTSLLPAYYHPTTHLLPAYYQPTTSLLPAYYQHTTSILPAYYQHTASILPVYYQHTTSILPAYYQHTTNCFPGAGVVLYTPISYDDCVTPQGGIVLNINSLFNTKWNSPPYLLHLLNTLKVSGLSQPYHVTEWLVTMKTTNVTKWVVDQILKVSWGLHISYFTVTRGPSHMQVAFQMEHGHINGTQFLDTNHQLVPTRASFSAFL